MFGCQSTSIKQSHRCGTFVLLALVASISCTKNSDQKSAIDPAVAAEVGRDLQLPGQVTILETAFIATDRPELGERTQALVLHRNGNEYVLQVVYRYAQASNDNFRQWRTWCNCDVIDDGTGAEVPALERFPQEPNQDQIAAFKSAMLGTRR